VHVHGTDRGKGGRGRDASMCVEHGVACVCVHACVRPRHGPRVYTAECKRRVTRLIYRANGANPMASCEAEAKHFVGVSRFMRSQPFCLRLIRSSPSVRLLCKSDRISQSAVTAKPTRPPPGCERGPSCTSHTAAPVLPPVAHHPGSLYQHAASPAPGGDSAGSASRLRGRARGRMQRACHAA
jgi:hypothetical protein